jgi:hypothetical protein
MRENSCEKIRTVGSMALTPIFLNMFRIVFLLLCIAINGLVYCQTVDLKNPESVAQDRIRDAYKRNGVKGVTVTGYKTLSDADNNINGIIEETNAFDRKGFAIFSKQLVGQGRQITMLQEFDSLGNLVGFRQYYNDKLNQEGIYYYNQNNELISSVTINAGGKKDSVGNKTRITYEGGKKITVNAPGAFAAKSIAEMDERNRIYKTTTFGQDGRPIQITEFQLNEAGQILRKDFLKSVSGKISATVYVYNEKQLLTETKRYDRNNMIIEITKSEYDENGLLNRETEFSFAGEVTGVTTYEYSFF